MNNHTFVTRQFHLWPFYGFRWRGFLPTYSINVNSEAVTFSLNGRLLRSFKPENVCLAHFKNTWFGAGRLKLRFAHENEKLRADDEFCYLLKHICYLNPESLDEAIKCFKEANVKCFRPEAVSLKNGKMWMSGDKVVKYRNWWFFMAIYWHKILYPLVTDYPGWWLIYKYYTAIDSSKLKYFYTQKSIIPFRNPVLITGGNDFFRTRAFNNNDINKLKQNVIANGAKLGEISNAIFKDKFTMKVIFSPSLWFTSSSIGLGDEGVSYNLKTIKTSDNLFIPYDKINYVTSTGSWYQRTRELFLFGEQNILPRKRFMKDDVKRLIEELREKGIRKLEGRRFSESYHTTVWGILFCILTLSIWHWIVVAFTKSRKSIIIGEESCVWNGETWLIDFDTWERHKPKNNKLYAGNCSDCKAICYYKKHWYYLWGIVYIWASPRNLRLFAFEAGQDTEDYDLEMGKVWFWNAWRLRKEMEANGFKSDKECTKSYKKWIKTFRARHKTKK